MRMSSSRYVVSMKPTGEPMGTFNAGILGGTSSPKNETGLRAAEMKEMFMRLTLDRVPFAATVMRAVELPTKEFRSGAKIGSRSTTFSIAKLSASLASIF